MWKCIDCQNCVLVCTACMYRRGKLSENGKVDAASVAAQESSPESPLGSVKLHILRVSKGPGDTLIIQLRVWPDGGPTGKVA